MCPMINFKTEKINGLLTYRLLDFFVYCQLVNQFRNSKKPNGRHCLHNFVNVTIKNYRSIDGNKVLIAPCIGVSSYVTKKNFIEKSCLFNVTF